MVRNTKEPVKLEKNPLWYKRGIIYEVHVRAFHDSNGDGTGDFCGLTQRLDYLHDLGITAIWLLPFYPSPLKDDGYDIADYYNVHQMYGTLADFKVFLRQAHRRGLRVITELVLNHTSDQHPWFQRARRARPGSRWRDFYVWSDTADRYKGTRIIFKDTEISNWTWDHVANAYYWHRFYSHQPDLNFDNPAVHEEMRKVLDFWLDMGVDGLRLDAVPYLYEREGTSCENLPETHQYLKEVRKHVDEKYGDRMLLAEANQWPEDAVTYFGSGKGDECHMAFHFPLMPRLFMALRMEDRLPLVDILQQTPPIPETAQWALFLRNHDELTLEMVTDEERDYMYRMYAQVHQARLNLGIRRRLAPLVDNDRRRIELLYGLLFSLPGTPVIYYGDEIGMGENIFLGDRNGVRTPMQWSADRNAGFSRANPQSLYLPINLDPDNHYEAVNVDVQQRNPYSLLWWMKRLMALYKRRKALGQGTLEFLNPENRKVFACVRRIEDERILVVANLSRFTQPAELDLSLYQGLVPVELFGRTTFPAISKELYFLTLAPHAFYWFSLEAKHQAVSSFPGSIAEAAASPLQVEENWAEIFQERHHAQLEAMLQNCLPSRRWFGGKARSIKAVHMRELVPVPLPDEQAFILFLEVEFMQGEPETYIWPLAYASGSQAEALLQDNPNLLVSRLRIEGSGQEGVLYDAIAHKEFCRAMLDLIAGRRYLRGQRGSITATHTAVMRKLRMEHGLDLAASVSKSEQSNSSIIYGERLILKFFRRPDAGLNPDLDIGRFLTARKFPYTPPLAGALEYQGRQGERRTLGILSVYVPGCRDAWEYTLDTLSRYYDRVLALPAESRTASIPPGSLLQLAAGVPPPPAADMIGSYIEAARMLGHRTAALHLVLASENQDPEFSPEPFTAHYQRGLFQSMRNLTLQNLQLLRNKVAALPVEQADDAQKVLASQETILECFRQIYARPLNAVRLRHHGDYHLGQVLYTGKDFLILDFEGEPARSLSERRLKRPPLRDVAGMIRSFHYAAYAGLLKQIERGTLNIAHLHEALSWMAFWHKWVSAVFLHAYRHDISQANLLPPDDLDFEIILDAYLLEKAIYELGYELNNRPAWVRIPLQGILDLLGQT